MTETLLLRMPEAGRPAAWQVVDAFGNRMGQPQSGALADAAAAAAGRRLHVCVPGAAVTLLRADIPTHNTQKLLQAVPFAVEDRLAEDIETLHFALGEHDAHGYLVAVVTRARLRQWLDELTAAGLQPAELSPDMLALPARDDTVVIAVDGGQLLARFPDGMAVAADPDLMPLLIQRHLAGLPEAGRCHRALVYASDETAVQPISAALANLQLETAYHPLNAGVIGLLASGARDARGVNLLQGEFSLHGSARERWGRWRTAAALLAALCVAFIVQQIVSEVRLRHESAALQAQITALFHQALPDVTRMVDPQAQMQQRLNQLSGGGAGSAGLLPMLAAVGAALQTQNGVQLQGFSYHGGDLQLQVQAGSIDALDGMKTALARNSAFQVNLNSISSSAGQTTGRLTLNGGGE